MAVGRLEVNGTIDLSQFWPVGSSDADTTKIIVSTAPGAFRFLAHPGAAFQVTRAFDNAIVRGRVRKPAIDNQGRITVRLQGIDAPELHYRPSAALRRRDRTSEQQRIYLELNEEYRQYLAETATVALRRINPATRKVGQDFKVLGLRQHLRLEPAHGAKLSRTHIALQLHRR
jgi:hypothetical protein